MAGERAHYREVKQGLRKSLFAGTFLVGRYSFSPYMACGHGCTYCDGRAERLAEFMRRAVEPGCVFDYTALRFQCVGEERP